MPRIVLNATDRPVEPALSTWGELLDALDTDSAATGQVVTAARFDGVEEPAFRDPELATRALHTVDVVELTAEPPARLLGRTIEEAATSLETLAAAARHVGASFREYDIVSANQSLAELAGGLRSLIALVSALGMATRQGLEQVSCTGRTASVVVGELTNHIEALIEAQHSEDWITVADVLEYDVHASLLGLLPALDAFRAAATAASQT